MFRGAVPAARSSNSSRTFHFPKKKSGALASGVRFVTDRHLETLTSAELFVVAAAVAHSGARRVTVAGRSGLVVDEVAVRSAQPAATSGHGARRVAAFAAQSRFSTRTGRRQRSRASLEVVVVQVVHVPTSFDQILDTVGEQRLSRRGHCCGQRDVDGQEGEHGEDLHGGWQFCLRTARTRRVKGADRSHDGQCF